MGRKATTITIMVKSNERADEMVARGIRMGGKKLKVERYINSGPDTICGNCAR
jgi:predicted lactoylglutathione lyase